VVGQKIEKILEGQSVQPVKVKDQPKAKKINFFRKIKLALPWLVCSALIWSHNVSINSNFSKN
jgi:hypothetical protein